MGAWAAGDNNEGEDVVDMACLGQVIGLVCVNLPHSCSCCWSAALEFLCCRCFQFYVQCQH